eukprot:911518_1
MALLNVNDLSATFTIIYITIYTMFMLAVVAYVQCTKHQKCFSIKFIKIVWTYKKIFGEALVMLYDTATDIGVLISWYILYTNDIDYTSVDMAVFFWLSCSVLLFYRTLSFIIVARAKADDSSAIFKALLPILCLLDLAILDGIYVSITQETELTPEQKISWHTQRNEISARLLDRYRTEIFDDLFDVINQRRELQRQTWNVGSACLVETSTDNWLPHRIVSLERQPMIKPNDNAEWMYLDQYEQKQREGWMDMTVRQCVVSSAPHDIIDHQMRQSIQDADGEWLQYDEYMQKQREKWRIGTVKQCLAINTSSAWQNKRIHDIVSVEMKPIVHDDTEKEEDEAIEVEMWLELRLVGDHISNTRKVKATFAQPLGIEGAPRKEEMLLKVGKTGTKLFKVGITGITAEREYDPPPIYIKTEDADVHILPGTEQKDDVLIGVRGIGLSNAQTTIIRADNARTTELSLQSVKKVGAELHKTNEEHSRILLSYVERNTSNNLEHNDNQLNTFVNLYITELNGEYEEQLIEEGDRIKDEMLNIEVSWYQYLVMFVESIFESMPQVVIQAVFLVKSSIDDRLTPSDQYLVLISLILSVLSISKKFYFLDTLSVRKMAVNAFKRNMINPYFLLRMFWRFFHILCRFSIFSLCWMVLGGESIAIYVAVTECFYCCYACFGFIWIGLTFDEAIGLLLMGLVGMPILNNYWLIFIPRWIDNAAMLILITLFANSTLDCSFCSTHTREMVANDGVFAFIMIGWVSFLFDISLFLGIVKVDIIEEDIYFDLEGVYAKFQKYD